MLTNFKTGHMRSSRKRIPLVISMECIHRSSAFTLRCRHQSVHIFLCNIKWGLGQIVIESALGDD